MAATAAFPAANYRTQPFVLSNTSETTVLSANAEFAGFQVVELWLADDGGAARTATIVADIAGTSVTLAYQEAIATNTPLQLNFTGLVLNKNDSNTDALKVTASAAGLHGYVGYIAVGRTG